MLERLMLWGDHLLRQVLVILMLAMVADVCWQVISRYLLQSPSSFSEEVARFLLIWIGFLGGAYAYRRRLHLGIDVFVNALSPVLKRGVECIAHFASAMFVLLVLIIGGSHLTWLTWELDQVSGALGIPMACVYLVIPLSGVFMLSHSVLFIHKRLSHESNADSIEGGN